MDPRTYLPCLKCDSWIPHYAESLHTLSCHKPKGNKLEITHPLIKDGCIHAKFCVIKAEKSTQPQSARKSKGRNKQSKNSSENWHVTEEPVWVQNLDVPFKDQFCFINDSDCLRCGIEGFTPVILQVGVKEAVFLAVPESGVPICNIYLYEAGISHHLQIPNEAYLISVKKIENLNNALEVDLNPCTVPAYLDRDMLQRSLRKKFQSQCSFGSPFIYKNNDSINHKYGGKSFLNISVSNLHLNNQSFSLSNVSNLFNTSIIDEGCSKSSIADASIGKLSHCQNKNVRLDSSTLIETVDQFSKINLSETLDISLHKNKITQEIPFENLEKSLHKSMISQELPFETLEKSLHKNMISQETPLETLENSPHKSMISQDTPYRTSTPRSCGQNSQQKKKLKKRCNKSKFMESSSTIDETFPSNLYYCLNKHSKLNLETEEPLEESPSPRRIEYFKDKTFFSIKELLRKKILYFNHPNKMLYNRWSGIMLSGLPGTGKTLLVHELSHELGLPLVSVSLQGWTQSELSYSSYIKKAFSEAKNCAPSIVFFDEIDSLSQTSGNGGSELVTPILKIMHEAKTFSKPLIFLSASNQPELVSIKLKQSSRFDKEVVLTLPDIDKKADLLRQMLSEKRHFISEEEIRFLSSKALGFAGADFDTAMRIAWHEVVQRFKTSQLETSEKLNTEDPASLALTAKDMEKGIRAVIPSFLRQKYTAVTQVKWSDILGYEKIKHKLREMIDLSVSGNRNLKGVLLYGPPGCSKTMLVRAIVTETQFTFFPIKCSDLLSKYVGETEKSLCALFERALQSAPSLIFMDEVDSLCGERSKSHDGSVISELLSLMHMVRRDGNILIIGATNRPDAVDEALFSPGCFELMLHVDLPDCQTRCAMWNGFLQDVPHQPVNVTTLCSMTEGFSGAEVASAYQQAVQSLIASYNSETTIEGEVKQIELTEDCILRTLSTLSPSTPSYALSSIKAFIKKRS